MRQLLEQSIATIEDHLVLVAPPTAIVPNEFRSVRVEPTVHRRLVRDVQQTRGSVYLEDGAVQRHQLSSDGLHETPEDDRAWHLLVMNENRVVACAWLLQHDVEASFEDLRVRNSPLAQTDEWRPRLWYAVESELARARAEGLFYGELGGWAVTKESRCTSDVLLLALATFGLARNLGGGLGMTTATVRHSSSAILRRLGGTNLQVRGEEVPAYFDPRYGCTMELIRFDSRVANPKYASLIETVRQKLAWVPTIACGNPYSESVSHSARMRSVALRSTVSVSHVKIA